MDRSNRQATTPRSTFSALASRNYRLYWLGLVCYVFGHRAEYVTFAWMMWEVSGDPLHLGYLGLAQGVPLVAFQLFGGVLADRINRLRLLLGTQMLTAATLAAAFGSAWRGSYAWSICWRSPRSATRSERSTSPRDCRSSRSSSSATGCPTRSRSA